jgi:DeoR family transcriptional regulator, ulaG and ulaABCDEF operon transcriptional repressor
LIKKVTMGQGDRKRAILEFLGDRPFATVHDLTALLGASPATVRRDIAKLHAVGSVRKVFGGIAAMEAAAGPERISARPFAENQTIAVAQKAAIATAAERLVSDGDALIIHGGSTCLMFAQRLASRSLRIYTNSMPLAASLAAEGVCHLTVAGGELYREPGVLYTPNSGPPEFYASKFFLGAQAIDASGLMESSPLIAQEINRLLARTDEVVVLADSRKFSIRTRHHVLGLSRISTLVTDTGLSEADYDMLLEAGINVILAEPLTEDALP